MICYLGKYPENNHTINNEPIGKIEWQDLQGGMTVVNDLVERQGIPVFELIDVALECATKVRINVSNECNIYQSNCLEFFLDTYLHLRYLKSLKSTLFRILQDVDKI